ncbi:Rod shape-determining protein MreD [Marinigracilibium pacificum]|uniref:Rod shape-determining protein MreD n=1 Tax=Marinigracilibium pacificum TaxID=2729599 RepID=A0A848J370_9BACT|nr:Rod shape-determining protein MreD [Marinigracilibium pacificum]NMM49778.1 Rod shape-determining protein MreD [Marinigracilibium pacificum]
MKSSNIKYILGSIAFILIQVSILKNVVLFDVAFCFLYVIILLGIPLSVGRVWQLIIGFGVGLTIDIFYNSMGIHAAAGLLLTFIRPVFLQYNFPRTPDPISTPTVKNTGLSWYLGYSFFLVFLHHCVIFFIEASNKSLFFLTLYKILASTIFTVLIIIIVQYLTVSGRKERLL